ncbi:YwqG family protein [Nonomuraea purpurea]|uniref:YwqG family protein n=1 Tax=Nonomuraea purpurea TaxID=1849276 RepID=A0ABV8GP69_9ACTN
MISLPALTALAHERLPADLVDRFCSLLKPRGQILVAARPGDEQVGVLGGEPLLPEGVDWPMWEGHGPLSFVAALDCGKLSAAEPSLPKTGILLFFYFDGQADNFESWVSASVPESRPGAQVLYLPTETPLFPRPTPSALKPYRRVPLRAVPAVELPQLTDYEIHNPLGLDYETVSTDPAYVGFQEAVWRLLRVHHQVGGWPNAIQGEVEYDVADFPDDWDLDTDTPDNPHYDDILDEVGRWRLLVQFASDDDADMMWGDGGALYWLITSEDLAAQRFDQARFTWQCH